VAKLVQLEGKSMAHSIHSLRYLAYVFTLSVLITTFTVKNSVELSAFDSLDYIYLTYSVKHLEFRIQVSEI
jgi:hypothetical protein